VTVQKLAELAEFYGVPVSELLPGAPHRASKPPAEPASSRAAATLFSRRAAGAHPSGEQRSPGRQRV